MTTRLIAIVLVVASIVIMSTVSLAIQRRKPRNDPSPSRVHDDPPPSHLNY